MLVVNDVHIGFNRQGGTTPASREALRTYLLTSFEQLIRPEADHLCVMGDLFDSFEISNRDWKDTYRILNSWLIGTDRKLTLVAGNHDHSAKGDKVSSFEKLCYVLKEQYYGERIKVIGIDQFDLIDDYTFALAHCSDQDTFNEKLKSLLDTFVTTGTRIFLHANYNNGMAAETDHSLNVTEAQAQDFIEAGATLYFAHEHQARTALGGRVIVWGNQFPTSISDCLHNDVKFAHRFVGTDISKGETWKRTARGTGFEETNWRELKGLVDTNSGFVRVVGNASSNEAGDCISAIAKFRSKCSAFVVSNAVKIEGIAENSDLPSSFEAAKAFEVNAFIDENLDEAQLVAVNRLRAL